jgi:arylformamidase
MEVIDLSRIISEDMPVYPGTEQPVITNPCTIEKCGFAEKKITLYSHTGTHIDAPCHIIPGALGLDNLGIGHFAGSGAVIEIPNETPGQCIGLSDVLKFEKNIYGKDFILIHTDWGRYWGKDDYFTDYPVLSRVAASYLAGFDIKGIGIDMISIDAPDSPDMEIHRIFLDRNIIIIENLASLQDLVGKDFTFFCFPLKMEYSDGSPVRAAAIIKT